ncbi:hypothetical protein SDJN03_26050, partial [Cucurbita argyrosperma subsp. sororia]
MQDELCKFGAIQIQKKVGLGESEGPHRILRRRSPHSRLCSKSLPPIDPRKPVSFSSNLIFRQKKMKKNHKETRRKKMLTLFLMEDLICNGSDFLSGNFVGLSIQILLIGLAETERPDLRRETLKEEEQQQQQVSAISLRQ